MDHYWETSSGSKFIGSTSVKLHPIPVHSWITTGRHPQDQSSLGGSESQLSACCGISSCKASIVRVRTFERREKEVCEVRRVEPGPKCISGRKWTLFNPLSVNSTQSTDLKFLWKLNPHYINVGMLGHICSPTLNRSSDAVFRSQGWNHLASSQ